MVMKTISKALRGLLDHLDRPVQVAQLKEEHSAPSIATVRSIQSSHPEVGLDPVGLANILRRAEMGDATSYLELAEAMEEKDLHYLGVLGTRKRAVSQLPLTVEAADDSPEAEAIAQEVRDLLARDTLEDELFDILDAVGKGFSVTEIIWDFAGGRWTPARFKYRLPGWFQFDDVDGETLRLRDGSAKGADLPPFKYIVHMHKAKSGLPIRGGLARAAAWAYLFKNYTLKDWVAFCEIYGIPFRLGKYGAGASDDDKRALLNALAMMGSDAAGIVPDSTVVEFPQVGGSTGDHGLFKGLSEYLDQQVSKAVLGQTSTTDAKGGDLGGSQAAVHNDVRADIERADAKLLAATLNQQLVVPFVQLNHGPQAKYPRVVIGREEALELGATMEATDKAVRLGVKVPVSWVRKLLRAPEPKGDEECLAAPAEPAPIAPPGADPAAPVKRGRQGAQEPEEDKDAPETPATASTRLFAALSGLSRPVDGQSDPIDGLTAAALSDWAPLLEPGIASIEERLAGCSSLEQARDVLLEALGDLDVDRMAETLARASFAARIAGRVGVSTVPEDEA